jgi:hypothetical protein
MNAANDIRARPARGPVRRIVTAMILGAFVFVALWLLAFSLFASLLISSGCCVVLVAASTISDIVEMILDAISAVIFGVLAAIAALFAAIFSNT